MVYRLKLSIDVQINYRSTWYLDTDLMSQVWVFWISSFPNFPIQWVHYSLTISFDISQTADIALLCGEAIHGWMMIEPCCIVQSSQIEPSVQSESGWPSAPNRNCTGRLIHLKKQVNNWIVQGQNVVPHREDFSIWVVHGVPHREDFSIWVVHSVPHREGYSMGGPQCAFFILHCDSIPMGWNAIQGVRI